MNNTVQICNILQMSRLMYEETVSLQSFSLKHSIPCAHGHLSQCGSLGF